jgi:hypothetical protein
MEQQLSELASRLEAIEQTLRLLVEGQAVREWYTTEQFAKQVGKAEFTVREWCRHGRLHAQKRLSGRGASFSWVISHEELLRYQREGLLALGCRRQDGLREGARSQGHQA